MAQKYKAVYFPDINTDSPHNKSLTLAFGKNKQSLYEKLKDLSSSEIRHLLGTDNYQELVKAANNEDIPVNTYSLRTIKQSLKRITEQKQQFFLPGFGNEIFDPISATFKGGAKEPFVRWYPYLEGYSPQFVKNIIETFAPSASRILDPFAGTATTSFTAAQLNIESYYCEINPVLQLISSTKITVRRLDSAHRVILADKLETLCGELLILDKYAQDYLLSNTYKGIFGTSEFFDQQTFGQILRIRTWIDSVSLTKPLLSDLITIATLSALVPASNMKRAGDLRYKTEKELSTQKVSLIEEIRKNILQIASDIRLDINGLNKKPVFIIENAQSLTFIPRLKIDTVITSPPYVNGTNYFRNTKIELWFLRCLNRKADLAKFRSKAVTSGINDVTVGKVPNYSHPSVQEVVNQLSEKAYDSRIPRMVAIYFHELTNIFSAIRPHLQNNAVLAIDIGDSAYAGVHVPVNRLLSKCLEGLNYYEENELTLRHRRSRGGMLLKQYLLIYKYMQNIPTFYVSQIEHPWRNKWIKFKTTLPHQKLPFAKRNWGHPRHSLCSYPGKLKPSIAHNLVNTFIPEDGSILDPFAGVGTIPFEAALQGKKSYGFEISPAAKIIANAKIQNPSHDKCIALIENLEKHINKGNVSEKELQDSKKFGFNGKLNEYFEARTLDEIILARRYFQENPPESSEDLFVMASLLHILHGNRPYALSRRSHPITPYKPSGEFIYKSLIEKLTQKVARGLKSKLPSNFVPGTIYFQDATKWWPREIDNLDGIITSPPFYDSTRFYLANWLRLWFAGWSNNDFENRPLGFVDERQKSSFEVYTPILRQARERIKPNGVVVLHLGKSNKCDMAEELKKLGKKWFKSIDSFNESVSHVESHGIRDKGTVTSHQYLILY